MSLDINTKKAKKNAFRIGKVRGEGASRIRVPGGYLKAWALYKRSQKHTGTASSISPPARALRSRASI